MNNKWWFENDGYGIVGWGFWCDNCKKQNNFVSSPEKEMTCEHCHSDVIFSQEEIDIIEKEI